MMLKALIFKIRTLFTKLRKSPKLTQKLMFSCEKCEIKFQKPRLDVVTRWNSTLQMLERAIEIQPALQFLTNFEKDLSNLSIDAADNQIITKLVDFLKGFEIATTIVCSSDTATIS
jgi:hypothetical protein